MSPLSNGKGLNSKELHQYHAEKQAHLIKFYCSYHFDSIPAHQFTTMSCLNPFTLCGLHCSTAIRAGLMLTVTPHGLIAYILPTFAEPQQLK